MTQSVGININETGVGSFFIPGKEKRLAEMNISIAEGELTVHDTRFETSTKNTTGRRLLNALVDYARSHELKVIALSAFVQRQFQKHLEKYADLWEKA